MPQRPSISRVYKELKAIRKTPGGLSEKGILEKLGTELINREEGKEIDKALQEV